MLNVLILGFLEKNQKKLGNALVVSREIGIWGKRKMSDKFIITRLEEILLHRCLCESAKKDILKLIVDIKKWFNVKNAIECTYY